MIIIILIIMIIIITIITVLTGMVQLCLALLCCSWPCVSPLPGRCLLKLGRQRSHRASLW